MNADQLVGLLLVIADLRLAQEKQAHRIAELEAALAEKGAE